MFLSEIFHHVTSWRPALRKFPSGDFHTKELSTNAIAFAAQAVSDVIQKRRGVRSELGASVAQACGAVWNYNGSLYDCRFFQAGAGRSLTICFHRLNGSVGS